MWKKTENSDNVKPLAVEKGASPNIVYVRRNFVLVPAVKESEQLRPEHWEYEENEIDVKTYELYEDLQDLTNAVVELAEMVGE